MSPPLRPLLSPSSSSRTAPPSTFDLSSRTRPPPPPSVFPSSPHVATKNLDSSARFLPHGSTFGRLPLSSSPPSSSRTSTRRSSSSSARTATPVSPFLRRRLPSPRMAQPSLRCPPVSSRMRPPPSPALSPFCTATTHGVRSLPVRVRLPLWHDSPSPGARLPLTCPPPPFASHPSGEPGCPPLPTPPPPSPTLHAPSLRHLFHVHKKFIASPIPLPPDFFPAPDPPSASPLSLPLDP